MLNPRASAHPILVGLVLLALLLAVSSCGGKGTGDPPGQATVTHVVDGDTVEVKLDGQVERVRLLGIDTPESVRPGTPVECFAPEASQEAKTLLPGGTKVRLERDREARDRYGRLLAYVYRADDGAFVNLELVRSGHAGVLVLAPNRARAPELRAAESEARSSRRGLWGACGSVHQPAARSP